jgi:CheY-like chemotaxis protein
MRRNPKILIVDDNSILAETIEELFIMGLPVAYDCEKCLTAVAADVEMALHLLREQGPFDFVLTDGHMPETDGIELILAIRAGETEVGTHGTPRSVPCGLATGWGEQEYNHRLSDTDISFIFQVPYDPTELLNSVARVLVEKTAT